MPDDLKLANRFSCHSSADLIPGQHYVYLPPGAIGSPDHCEPVTLVGFTPYPATVIILDRWSRRLYCDRRRLFSAA